jgi:hypothetical protein
MRMRLSRIVEILMQNALSRSARSVLDWGSPLPLCQGNGRCGAPSKAPEGWRSPRHKRDIETVWCGITNLMESEDDESFYET